MDWPARYIAQVAHVREVSLLGTADLRFWKHRLAERNLVPFESESRALILITAADMRFMGVRFQELSFSVLASFPSGPLRRGAYLVNAFNTSRLFTWCERRFFSTPYRCADVHLCTALPASIRLIVGQQCVFLAEMCIDPATPIPEPARSGEDGWEGPVVLPQKPTRRCRRDKVFFARICGHTRAYPFVRSRDAMVIVSSSAGDIFEALIESHFVATEWAIREDATHAKSRTMSRDHANRLAARPLLSQA